MVNHSQNNFFDPNTNLNQSQQHFAKISRAGSSFKYSQNHYRKSFFELIPGPNEQRFIKFNDMPSNSSKYALDSRLTRATTDFAKTCSREANISGARLKNSSAYLNYDVGQHDIQEALKQNLRNSSKKLLLDNDARTSAKTRQSRDKGTNYGKNPLAKSLKDQLNDPSSHFERNVKRYTYEGAASTHGHNLDILTASKNLGHAPRPLHVLEWDLQQPRDTSLYNISVTQNLKSLDQKIRQ